MAAEPRLLFADDALLVIEKPAGLLAVPGRGAEKQDCVSARMQAQFADALIVHRLDMATSGLMLMARGKAAQQGLSRAFAARQVGKRYQALVDGRPAPPGDGWGVIDLPIALDWPNRPRRIVQALHGQASLTRWRVMGSVDEAHTSVELEPLTGRSHQLRVHLLAIGHPIVGDQMYFRELPDSDAKRLMLHATRLRFAHPVTGTPMQFDSRPDFAR